MVATPIIPVFDFIGTIGFLVAVWFGIANFRTTTVERPFWIAFTFTAGLGSLWLALVTIEWVGISSVLMDQFSTALQAVVIGLFAVGVIGTHALVQDLQQSRIETVQQASIASILSRVLRHDLRNQLTVIRGLMVSTEAEAEAMDEADQQLLSSIDWLIERSVKARRLERAVGSDPAYSAVDLREMLGHIVVDVRDANPAATIELSGPEAVTATVMPGFDVAIRELVENALEHGGEAPTVTISLDVHDDSVGITITDDGPGMPEHERALLARDIETSLVHSDGLGLWLATWIMANHDGSIDVAVDGGTRVTVTIPAEPEPIETKEDPWPEGPNPGFDRYQAVFENVVDGLVVFDDERRIIDANRQAGELAARSSTDLLGRPVSVLVGDADDIGLRVEDPGSRGVVRGEVAVSADGTIDGSTTYVVQSDIAIGEHLLALRQSPEDSKIV